MRKISVYDMSIAKHKVLYKTENIASADKQTKRACQNMLKSSV